MGAAEDFFPEVPDDGASAESPPAPPWSGPPPGFLPGVVALQLVLARNERAAIYIGRCAAYPTGLEFEVRVIVAPGVEVPDPSMMGPRARLGCGTSNRDEMLKLAVQFPDGRKVTNLDFGLRGSGEPSGPVLVGLGGSATARSWQQEFWCWPLPGPGKLAFVCQWPAAEITLCRTEIDTSLIREAAASALELFPGQPSAEEGPSDSTWCGNFVSGKDA
jgi:hypothetical protein